MKVLLRGLNVSDDKLRTLEVGSNMDMKSFKKLIRTKCRQYRKCRFVITFNGKICGSNNNLNPNDIYSIRPLMLGGKGGFGSLLKGQPPVKKRTNNFDSCRDLSGRRIRHVNQEKMLQEWQKKKAEEDKLLREYETGDNVKEMLIAAKKSETDKLNEKFIQETNNITNSVSASIKYLLKKKKRDAPAEASKPAKHTIIEELKDLESIEKELFSL
jgi:hypothetical protein